MKGRKGSKMKKEYEVAKMFVIQVEGKKNIIFTSLNNMGGNGLEGESGWGDLKDDEE